MHHLSLPKCILTVVLFVFLCVPQASGQTTEVVDPITTALDRKINTFFQALTSKTAIPQEAFEKLLTGSHLATPAKAKAVEAMVTQANLFNQKYGTYVEHERVAVNRIGRDLIRLTYLYKAKKSPVVWRFTFYRPTQTAVWRVIGVKFNTKLDNIETDS